MLSLGCVSIINVLRKENLRDLLKPLTKADDSELTVSLEEIQVDEADNLTAQTIAVKLAGAEAATCNLRETAGTEKYTGVVIPSAHNTDFDCNALIQATYTAGLPHLEESNFDPTTSKYVIEAPFNNVAVSTVAFLLSAKSAKVSCAATKDC
ncbi:SAG family member [Eimeria necatrix]|uniref:SAG family member n=1 Tax=Eimeria necatrix TaxID=51315 RepID=U6MIB8_9EIME|nr:SAG family member [Eimeria necatrix]CDJ62189.1 SAG family member [Eimeria necatrix]